MVINREKYISEDLRLIVSSLEGSINKFYNTRLLRKFSEGEIGVMKELFDELVRIEIFSYINSSSLIESSILNDILGSKLLPGILVTTIIATKSISEEDILEGIYKGKIKVAFSDSEYVPAADLADVIIINDKFAWKEEAEIETYKSLDNSMKISKVKLRKFQNINFNVKNTMVNLAAQMAGGAEVVLKMSIEYAKNRIAFGKPIGSYQAIKHKLVDDAMTVELARTLFLEASKNLDYAALAKYYADKKLIKVAMDGIQVHGGIGFTDEIDIHLYLRRILTLSKIYHPNKIDVLALLGKK
jgi:hypothetical protein